jgi:hypothetical protein
MRESPPRRRLAGIDAILQSSAKAHGQFAAIGAWFRAGILLQRLSFRPAQKRNHKSLVVHTKFHKQRGAVVLAIDKHKLFLLVVPGFLPSLQIWLCFHRLLSLLLCLMRRAGDCLHRTMNSNKAERVPAVVKPRWLMSRSADLERGEGNRVKWDGERCTCEHVTIRYNLAGVLTPDNPFDRTGRAGIMHGWR